MRVINNLKNGFEYGMHGCGYYKGAYHSNALEPFSYWQARGVDIMEIDIAKTKDNKFVALAHLMNDFYLEMAEITLPTHHTTDSTTYTEDWFLKQRLFRKTTGGLTPMNLKLILEAASTNPNLIIMFDLWRMWNREDTELFAHNLMTYSVSDEVLNRCVVEVYNKEMYYGVKEANTNINIMYCVHGPKAPDFDEKVTPSQLKEMGVSIISFPWECTADYPGEIQQYHNEGFTIFSLSKDNRNYRKMKECGVNVNLVDILYKPQTVMRVTIDKCIVYLNRIVRKIGREMKGLL